MLGYEGSIANKFTNTKRRHLRSCPHFRSEYQYENILNLTILNEENDNSVKRNSSSLFVKELPTPPYPKL
ncbi:4882_t:CDS:2 [Entrophospora sp. SA101]|nr:14635_t:CDS:2 [Entrophospora sp. SA101]CAJ0638240.1 4882_t:CDS:2 [Entrophospora sp. SA101]CAJ0830802.1 3805_t:CDS:2 [Entrophospora sp. SA101]CAJ0835482.1 11026_t:CDS:2 [Entrophospora sp. SA101]CAJ0845193.1 1430_t:CDS:2 [Entrophospora sp. SA101]